MNLVFTQLTLALEETELSRKTLGVPHLFSKLSIKEKSVIKKRYQSIKTRIITGSAIYITGGEVKQLIKDMVLAELKLYGYKFARTVLLPPFFSSISLSLFTLTRAGKIRKTAILLSQIAATMMQYEYRIANCAFLVADLLLFGEYVPLPVAENYNSLSILHNATTNEIVKLR
jgi:hypothetical protein